jgi:ketosteroid isomerase-like protein
MHETESLVGGGTFTGKEEFMGASAAMTSLWDDVTAIPKRFIADEDAVVTEITWSATAKETGRSVSLPGVHVFDLKDGKVVEWTSYIDSAGFNSALED